jgi:hypothetical protein
MPEGTEARVSVLCWSFMRNLIISLSLVLLTTPALAQPVVYSGPGNGVGDNTSSFNMAVSSVCASGQRTLRVPAGNFLFLSAPARIPCALNLIGEGPAVTHLIRGYTGTGFIIWEGGQDGYGGGSLRDLMLDAGTTSGGIGLWVHAHLETDPTVLSKNPHGLLVDNVLIGSTVVDSTSGWGYGVYLDGGDNANPPSGVAPGIRFVKLNNVSVSKASTLAYLFYYAMGTRAEMIDCFIPRGTSGVTAQGLNSQATYVVSPSCTLVTP